MRVIAGIARGHKLVPVPGSHTRPTTDRVKEAIFSMIGPYFEGGIGLDLFAGTGGLGIEALSRGLDRVIFVDQQPQAIRVIKQNLTATRLIGQAEIYRKDAGKLITWLQQREIQFRVIFLDPPYSEKQLVHFLEEIGENNLLRQDGVVVLEHSAAQSFPDVIAGLTVTKQKKYGHIHISLFRHAE